MVAMVGKDCVAIAADRRLGVQGQTVSTDFKKIYEMNDKLYIGFYGLATDAQTVYVNIMYTCPYTHMVNYVVVSMITLPISDITLLYDDRSSRLKFQLNPVSVARESSNQAKGLYAHGIKPSYTPEGTIRVCTKYHHTKFGIIGLGTTLSSPLSPD